MKRAFLSFLVALGVSVLTGPAAFAQDANYNLSLTGPAEAGVGATADVTVALDSTDGDPIQGWQWGVCHTLASLADGDVVSGADTDGLSFTFEAISTFDDGWTVGALLNVITMTTIAPGVYNDMYVATYTLDTAGTADFEWCETLGTPMVSVRVIVASDEIEPVQENLSIEVADMNRFTYVVDDVTVNYAPADGVATAVNTMSLFELEESPTFPSETQGFQIGLAYDDAVVEVIDAAPAGALADLQDGDGPDFFGSNFTPANGPGITVGIVYSLMGGLFIEFDTELDVIEFTFGAVEGVLVGDEVGLTTDLTWVNDLGSPVLPNSVVVAGQSFDADLDDGSITFNPVMFTAFIRGDANDDGRVNIADAVTLVSAKLIGGAVLNCEAAGDANGDLSANLADAVYILNYRFLSGPPPPAPFPGCDISEDEDCESFDSCP